MTQKRIDLNGTGQEAFDKWVENSEYEVAQCHGTSCSPYSKEDFTTTYTLSKDIKTEKGDAIQLKTVLFVKEGGDYFILIDEGKELKTPEEFTRELKKILAEHSGDNEVLHAKCDELMISLLDELGFVEGVKILLEVDKHYS